MKKWLLRLAPLVGMALAVAFFAIKTLAQECPKEILDSLRVNSELVISSGVLAEDSLAQDGARLGRINRTLQEINKLQFDRARSAIHNVLRKNSGLKALLEKVPEGITRDDRKHLFREFLTKVQPKLEAEINQGRLPQNSDYEKLRLEAGESAFVGRIENSEEKTSLSFENSPYIDFGFRPSDSEVERQPIFAKQLRMLMNGTGQVILRGETQLGDYTMTDVFQWSQLEWQLNSPWTLSAAHSGLPRDQKLATMLFGAPELMRIRGTIDECQKQNQPLPSEFRDFPQVSDLLSFPDRRAKLHAKLVQFVTREKVRLAVSDR